MDSGSDSRESLQSGTEEELQRRLSLVGPEDVARGLFFISVLDMVRRHGDEAVFQHCLEVSGETRFMEFFNYPLGSWLRMVYVAARHLGGTFGGFDGALRELGYQASRTFLQSSAGRALLLVANNDPLRLLQNMPSATRIILGDNVGVSDMKRTGLMRAVLVYKRDLVPRPYNEGGLRAALESVNAKDVTVHARPTAPFDTDYELSWL